MIGQKDRRWLFLAGGACGVVYPILELSFYALYPLAARDSIVYEKAGEGFGARLVAVGAHPLAIALEWMHTFLPLLLLPFALALYRLLTRRDQHDLALLALVLLSLSLALTLPSHLINVTVNHDLAQSYVDAESEAERAAIAATLRALGAWHRGLNVVASVLYQAFVGLSSADLVLRRIYRVRGWLGIGGALFAMLKFTTVWPGMTDFLWTGVAYAIWPVAVGIGLLRQPRQV